MRITQGQTVADSLANIQSAEKQTATLQVQISSGQKINQASDDPAGAGRLVRIDSELASNKTAQSNATLAQTDLGAQDSALQQLSTILSQARELAVQGANGSLSPSDLAALKTQADGLVNQAVSIANTQVDGRSIFAGTATQTTPYSVSSTGGVSTVTYSGSATSRSVPIGDSSIVAGAAGPGPFASSGGATGALDAIAALRDALGGTGGTTAVQGTLSGLDSAIAQTTLANAQVGSRMSDLSELQDGLTTQATQLSQVRSSIDDTDITSAAAQLAKQQQTYQQGLQVLAQVMSTSILTYLPPGTL